MKSLRFLVVVGIFCASCTCVASAQNEYQDFIKATEKNISGQLWNDFKRAEEIPAFANSAAVDKQQWNINAKRFDQLSQRLRDGVRKIENHPTTVTFRKTQDELWEKEEAFNKGIAELVQKNPRAKEIENELKLLRQANESVWKKWRSFFKTKIEPLEEKLKGLIGEAYKKEYGSATAWWDMTPAQTDSFEAKVKETEEYKGLQEQLKSLKEQENLLRQEQDPIYEKIRPLQEELRQMKEKVKASEDLPEELKELSRTVEQLRKDFEKASQEYRKFDLEEANKMRPVTNEIQDLSMKLFEQYKKMAKQK